ncbi:MAG TPA: phycobiliprotein lyase [Halomicronema sp.]
MDIKEFFTQSTGKWFSQRTNHHLNPPHLEASKTDLWIDSLPTSDPNVIKLCEEHKIDPSSAFFGINVKWDAKIGPDEIKQTGTTILIVIPEDAKTGQIIQQSAGRGNYSLGNDEALTITLKNSSFSVEERIWFESPNLRLRTSTVNHSNGSSVASFCSEIRMGGVPPKNA